MASFPRNWLSVRTLPSPVLLQSSPTSPRTAQSGRFPSGPAAGPLGAMAASDAGWGGVAGGGRGTHGAIVSSPPTKSILLPRLPPLLDLAFSPREDSWARIPVEVVLFCCCCCWCVVVEGFTFRIRIFLRGAGFPVEPSLGSVGGDAPTSALIATILVISLAVPGHPALEVSQAASVNGASEARGSPSNNTALIIRHHVIITHPHLVYSRSYNNMLLVATDLQSLVQPVFIISLLTV